MKEQSTTNTKGGSKPTHTIWIVKGEGKAASYFPIAGAWAHKDGLGYSGDSHLGRIVIRPIKEKAEATGDQQ